MANEYIVLTPGRVASFIGKPGPGGYKIYLTTRDGRSWVEFGGRGVSGNPRGMKKQPNLGFASEGDAWSFAEKLLRDHPEIVEKPRSVFRLYDYEHPSEFYLSRSQPLRHTEASTPLAQDRTPVELFDNSRDPQKYERPNRPNQLEFRKLVFNRYGERCAFCRIHSPELLDAAHVIAWNEKGADVPENGLALCKLHHRAIDAGVIRIDPNTLDLVCSDGFCHLDLHVEATDIRHLPATPAMEALLWLWERSAE